MLLQKCNKSVYWEIYDEQLNIMQEANKNTINTNKDIYQSKTNTYSIIVCILRVGTQQSEAMPPNQILEKPKCWVSRDKYILEEVYSREDEFMREKADF